MIQRVTFVAVAALLSLASTGLPAGAQELGAGLRTRIREISFDDDRRTRLVVSVSGAGVTERNLGSGDFEVAENGAVISDLSVRPFFSRGQTAAIALVMDVSGSTTGTPLAAAKEEAKKFLQLLPGSVRIALISFGADVSVPVQFTTDKRAVAAGIDALRAGGRTRMFDAVLRASELLGRQGDLQPTMVVFSDGNDTRSSASQSEAINALRAKSIPALSVLLATRRTQGEDELRALADAQEGGQFLRAQDQEQLGLAFTRIGQAIASQYVVSYESDDRDARELSISVTARANNFVATDSSVVLNRRTEAAPPPLKVADSGPLVPFLGNELGLFIGIAAAFLGVAFFIAMILWAPAEKSNERALARRLKLYSRSGSVQRESQGEAASFFASSLGQRATSFVEKVPRWNRVEESLQKELAQAGWPLRSSEFVLIQVGAAAAGFIVGAGLFSRFWLGVVLLFLGAVIPRFVLTTKITRRNAAFLEQLPETLQLLSGSLQAGYGFVQALDTVAKESPVPTSTEFSRVLTEARLGMPLEDALDEMADRVGGEDFRWVVLAINIQRQVGGNLAQLLTTVAATLRERERVRRQIKVLSAEGRLSAIILTALPFVLFGYLSFINPDYIGQLTGSTVGKIMMVGSLILIAIGALWMRKMIKIDV